MDVLWNIIMYAVPGGFAVQLINWYCNRKLSKARQGGDIDAAYLDNINMLREELIKIQDETENYTGLSLDLIVRLLALLLVVTGMIALFASSCKSPQRMQNSYSQKDSLASKNGSFSCKKPYHPA